MSLHLTRNIAIALSLVAFVIALVFAPAANLVFSAFLLFMGVALSTMVYVLWHQPPVAVALVAPRIDPDRRDAGSSR